MFRWLALCVVLCAGAFALVALATGKFLPSKATADQAAAPPGEGAPPDDTIQAAVVDQGADRGGAIVLSNARLTTIEREDAPSQHDGTVYFIGTDDPADPNNPGPELPKMRVSFLVLKLWDKTDSPTPPPALLKDGIALIPSADSHLKQAVPYSWAVEHAAPPPNPADQSKQPDRPEDTLYRRWYEGDPLDPGKIQVAFEEKTFHELKEGDWVKPKQLVAIVDPTVQIDDVAIKVNKLETAESEYKEAGKTKQEAERRAKESQRLYELKSGVISQDAYYADVLSAARYAEEEKGKLSALQGARQELFASLTILRLHEVRASIPGVIKTIYRRPGESVKNLDAIMQIQNPLKLRVEAQVGVQDAQDLREGMLAIVQPAQPVPPLARLFCSEAEVTCVAVSRPDANGRKLIVSGSEDGLVRFWDAAVAKAPAKGKENPPAKANDARLAPIDEHTGVLAVACTGLTAAHNLALTGGRDGVGRIINLDHLRPPTVAGPGADAATPPTPAPSLKLSERHKGPITCVAFSADGAICATGGEDRAIRLWKVADGQLILTLNAAHKAVVTSLQFVAPRPGALTVAVDGKDRTFAIPDKTAVTIGGQADKLESIQKGDAVVVHLNDDQVAGVEARPTVPAAPGDKETLVSGTVVSAEKAVPFQLVSAGGDYTLGIWRLDNFDNLDSDKTKPTAVCTAVLPYRSGDVAHPGVSADGKHLLFDHGNELRVLSLDTRQLEGVIQASGTGASFTTMALFSPDGATILTNSGSDGRLQLWRTPPTHLAIQAPDAAGQATTKPVDLDLSRALELRQFTTAATGSTATCGAFDPDGKSAFVVTGSRDGYVFVWNLPDAAEVRRDPLVARLAPPDRSLEAGAGQMRVWANLPVMHSRQEWIDSKLTPGGAATLVIPPGQ